ncbi:nuclease SbcCD subunit C [Arthrobacter sp. PAMC 25486]|nr:nuclease SbcCD subunit C [Arthrobacter sp. PAMC 25486]
MEIQAFGPFAGREIIDFDLLGAQGIFLLNGSTGAGKTSVLDAIAYALYGAVPGARSVSMGQLRSHHAAEGVGPEVLCEFSAGGRRLEVSRSPEWMRPVKRGSGTTREQASTQLREKTSDGWEVKSTRNDEAAAEIQELLGMNMAQFTKVVLLAQGDFAAFLRASAVDRQALLQRLFGTDVYEGVQERLAADSRTAQAAVAAGLAELASAEQLARSQSAQVLTAEEQAAAADGKQADATEEAAEKQAPPSELSGLELFEALREGLAAAVERTGANAGAGRFKAESLASAVTKAEGQRSWHLALAAALSEQARLAELAGEESQWRHCLDRHHQAQVLAAVVDTAAKTATASARAQSQTAASAASFDANELAAGQLGKASATATAAELESLDRELTKLLATVDAALPEETRHRQKAAELAENKGAQALVLKQQDEHSAAVTAAKARLVEVQARQEELRNGAHNVEQSAHGATAAAQLVATIEEYLEHSTLVELLGQAENAAREQALTAKENWLHALDLRLSQAAGELAAALVDGEPCQVCGSTVHPAPSPLAGKGADLVKAEKAAKKLFDAAEAAANTARSKLAEAKNTLAVLAERGGGGELQKARDAVVLKQQEHRQAVAAVAELEALGTESAALQQGMENAQASVLEASGKAASLAAGHSALVSEIEVLADHLTLVRDGHATLGQRRESLTRAQEPGAALLLAMRGQATAGAAADDAAEALMQSLDESVFADADEVRAALLGPADAAAIDQAIKDHARAIAVNTDRLAAPEVVAAQQEAAAGVPVPSDDTVAELVRSAAAARAEAETGVLAAGMARNAAAQLAATEAAFISLEEKVAPLRERAQLLAGLAETVRGGGDNRYKMTLSSYVLAARLEQVAQAASLRLATMSDARYTLRHSDAKKGNHKAGLGLVVVDEWTGLSRDTATLSGGESFMASLSLALGLSDVVQQESGGLDIETLFVDEGFGSLDEQSLEQVMDALEGLRDGGRMVGLVSHVAEMKQRIPLHLHVHKGRNGSTVELKMAGAESS